MLLIFDASQGYPARCIGRHPEDGDPTAITGLPTAVSASDVGFENEDTRYLFVDDDPTQGGQVLIDNAQKAEALAHSRVSRDILLGLVVALGVQNYILRQHTPGLLPQEQQALDIVGNALPDVDTLRTLIGRLEPTLQQAKAILETLAAS